MNKIGKIGAYDQSTGKGIILIIGSTEKVDFSIKDWNDSSNLPAFGITVEINEDGIKLIDEEIVAKTLANQKEEQERIIEAERVAIEEQEAFDNKVIDIQPEKEDFTFEEIRNTNYMEFKEVHPDYIIKSDKITSFFIKNDNGGYVHLKLADDQKITLEFFNSKLSKSFINYFKKFNINVKNIENDKEEIISIAVKENTENNGNSNKVNTYSNNTGIQEVGNPTLGIVAFVLCIVGIFAIPLIMQPAALIMGIISKNTFGKIAAIIAGIYITIIILSFIFGISLVMNNM